MAWTHSWITVHIAHCRYSADWVPLRTRLKSSPTTPDPALGMGGLQHRHMSRGAEPASRWGRARCRHVSWGSRPAFRYGWTLTSPHVLWHRAHLSVREGSSVAMCLAVPDPPPSAGGLWCHHVSRGIMSAFRCGRASSWSTWSIVGEVGLKFDYVRTR
jgi:hypothetical protein